MKAKALICDKNQCFALADVELPDPSADNIVIRTLYSGVSIGTEFALIRNRISWGPYPICTGYQAVGIIEHVGANTEGFQLGQKVYHRTNLSMRLADGGDVTCANASHCSRLVVNDQNTHDLAALPDNVSEEAASLFVMPAVGLFGVNMAKPGAGHTVVVNGCGLIGLGVVAEVARRGLRVIAVDVNEKRLAMARSFGADHIINPGTADLKETVEQIIPGGLDYVFECTGLPECIDPAISLCKRFGTYVWQGNYGKGLVQFDFSAAHSRRLTMLFPCNDGGPPFRRAVIKNMASGILPWDKVITHRITAEDSPQFYHEINTGKANDVIGAVIAWT